MSSFEILRKDAEQIINSAISEVLPDKAVKKALEAFINSGNYDKRSDRTEEGCNGGIYLVAIGKAAWQMAKAASEVIGARILSGIVITKYGHAQGDIPKLEICEAGHPVPDENTFNATEKAIRLVSDLGKDDIVIFLVSGGGSALFEKPYISGDELKNITLQLLACGADISEINTIRKRLSQVKGGRFAKLCEPANVYSIVLSDVIGDKLDVIASGPAYPDKSTSEEAIAIIGKYELEISDEAMQYIKIETPKEISNVTTLITGSVKELCRAAKKEAEKLGYETIFITDELSIEAKDAGRELAEKSLEYSEKGRKIALIEGGETVVKLTGKGKGGRNQEFALASSGIINGKNIAIFSVGSDGTDGPTDAAGGYVDGESFEKLKNLGIDIEKVLYENNSYEALKAVNGLIITGPTGTNVNDFAVALINPI